MFPYVIHVILISYHVARRTGSTLFGQVIRVAARYVQGDRSISFLVLVRELHYSATCRSDFSVAR